MNNVYFRLYLDSIISFTRTLVIKCDAIAETINTELQALGLTVDLDDPYSWKYYMNMAGEYHVTDTVMQVRSMDTLETIDFTVANLAIHRATAREYKPGSRYYKDLVRQYPDQVGLINGIIAPINKTVAINAKVGDIIYYDPTAIERNETQLIEELQIWVYGFFNKWYNVQYLLTDDLYLPSFWGILHLQIPSAVKMIRMKAMHTPQVHSFHIREFLASNSRLDTYIPYLSKEQQLFLYRNIRFIQRNVGKQEIFDTLIEKLLTKRGLPITWYKLRHNLENMPAELTPKVEMAKHPINFGYNQTGLDVEEVHTILTREREYARDNESSEYDTLQDINERFGTSQYNRLATKVLESEVVDRSNSSIRSIEDVLLNEWLHLVTTDRYRAYVNIPNPSTGEYMLMSVKDAFIVAIYAFARMQEIELDTIPRVYAYAVLRRPLPTYMDLTEIVDMRYIPDGFIQQIMDGISPLGEYITTEGFYYAAANLHAEYLKSWELYSKQEHYLLRGFGQSLVNFHFMDIKCELAPANTDFNQWLSDSGYDISDMNRLDYEQLYLDCIRYATGSNLVTRLTLAEIQRAMLALMGRLSSYSIQLLRNINHSDFRYVGIPDIRLGDISGLMANRVQVPLPRLTVLRQSANYDSTLNVYDTDITAPIDIGIEEKAIIPIDVELPMNLLPQNLGTLRVNMASVGVMSYSLVVHDSTPPDDTELEQYQL